MRNLPGRDGGEAHTFSSYLREHPRVIMHRALLWPAQCWHCGSSDGPAFPEANAGEHTAVPLPNAEQTRDDNRLDLEGRTCIRCAEEICRRTQHLRNDAVLEGNGGDTILHQATRLGKLRMFCHLMTLVGKECGHATAADILMKTNNRGETALHLAVSVGDTDMVELMLWVAPELGGRLDRDGISPMYLAVSLGRKDIAQELRKLCGDALSYSGPNGQNALHSAVLHGEEMTRMVLGWNEDLARGKDGNDSTPLHFALSVERRPLIRVWCWSYTLPQKVPTSHLLRANPAMAYQHDNQGLFPVHVAAMTNRWADIIDLLRSCPGCMSLRDTQGRTFLHVAVQNKQLRVVRQRFQPIMNIQDNNGNTALHLAVDAEHLGMVCNLLRNKEVCLNLRNKRGLTPIDVAKGKIRQGFFFGGNPDKVIYQTLIRVGAMHGNHRMDHLQDNCVLQLNEGQRDEGNRQNVASKDLDKEESEKMTSSTETLGIGSVLIATVTFGATFTLPGGSKADTSNNGGTPTLAGPWYFDAFMVANTLAFICSSVATVGLMYSGMAMVTLVFRRTHFNISLFFATSSVTCLTTAFALGVYMVLAPVARSTAILICAITPLVLLYKNVQSLWQIALVCKPLCARRGFWVSLFYTVWALLFKALGELWPIAVIFGWAGHLRHRRHG
ncbi:hypothetical protein EJB05_02865, partial [Eragrostis curvula]